MTQGIITHPRPHLDEIVAIFLLSLYGEEKYPGIRDAITNRKIFACRVEDLEATAEGYEQSGYIMLGVGGGRYDEHGVNGESRKKGDCCATLVAKDLGVDKLRELSKILKFVTGGDLNGNSQPFDLSALVGLINGQYPDDPFPAIDFAFAALNAKYAEQYDFHVIAGEEAKKATVEEVLTASGKKLRIVTVKTDCEAVGKYIRSEYGGGADIIIQKNSRRQVQIFTDKRSGLNMTDTAQILRLVEQESKDQEVVTSDWNLLAGEGKVIGAEEWYFFPTGNMLLNGSLTAPNTPPTNIALQDIQSLVKIGVNGMFEPSREQKCKQGNCSSRRDDECKWYAFGLQRCREVRRLEYQRRQTA
ncbi:MAG: hypothetical protein A3A96_02355 [Candidatus Zambryskibacteria bacterium RIFCSPLOWO2_01_FULL_39_39]|uniref:Uncharacterized protein n=1 Tax=Candidatus Zambryskibacteria bacterium RIFCSPLOWO2_01_FULL_39_39 TaxID=1802758 RepID=A0A1G2U174_9BACT|nr:MAG: hypothetical protein UT00_C0010G0040 [Parcubacteria group bacterium GW2011_GWA1_38_7]OHA86531.1 MAG: hypothetical protein A2644_00605 [Candidatus Zambryskibacteria bacterium RIFCSPHIGHO2_01_FULL_39_63]OHA94794.1 MAG: hypothetical protein A3B88_04115 [Candidatus Zambryskibacteria bacterium RIFCSPHIGHO2_02_FULL_39_19]OHA98284.1 MAG: hypothetical protein A3F20_01805 [Candidatus Zambryskibacteria bacterium RIFCSPHIGHO2_12_FULL_39_21]OHB02670.1 MAG: hypothetical protein A3A96_02355 [Candidat